MALIGVAAATAIAAAAPGTQAALVVPRTVTPETVAPHVVEVPHSAPSSAPALPSSPVDTGVPTPPAPGTKHPPGTAAVSMCTVSPQACETERNVESEAMFEPGERERQARAFREESWNIENRTFGEVKRSLAYKELTYHLLGMLEPPPQIAWVAEAVKSEILEAAWIIYDAWEGIREHGFPADSMPTLAGKIDGEVPGEVSYAAAEVEEEVGGAVGRVKSLLEEVFTPK